MQHITLEINFDTNERREAGLLDVVGPLFFRLQRKLFN